jgi:biopolymer transport protein ExbB
MEDLAAFTNDLHGYLMSGGAVKPRMAAPGGSGGRPTGQARTGAPQPGSEPVRHPTPAK